MLPNAENVFLSVVCMTCMFACAHMTKLMSVIAGVIKRCNKPVLVADSFCGFRYFLPEQEESRIRVSGTTTSLHTGLRLGTGGFCLRRKPRLTPHFLCALLLPVSSSCSSYRLAKICDITTRSVRLCTNPTMPEKHFERLPKSVVPKSYDLFLKPNLTSFTFEGREKIKVTVSYCYEYKIIKIIIID